MNNTAPETIKLRSCPKKFAACSGDMTKPNRYVDCTADIPGRSTASVLVNPGVGYLVVFYKVSGAEYQVNPTVKGGAAWPATIVVAPHA